MGNRTLEAIEAISAVRPMRFQRHFEYGCNAVGLDKLKEEENIVVEIVRLIFT
jgi:hypothetical protein